MRVNPLLIPLIVVLAAPFALGVADTVALTTTRTMRDTIHPIPLCLNCTVSSQINKEEAVQDAGCLFATQGQFPYTVQQGVCQRYVCSNGYYYTWSGWSDSGTCSANPEASTPCPTGSCTL